MSTKATIDENYFGSILEERMSHCANIIHCMTNSQASHVAKVRHRLLQISGQLECIVEISNAAWIDRVDREHMENIRVRALSYLDMIIKFLASPNAS